MVDEIKHDEKETPKEVGILDPNFFLLKEFREKAPGSYKHSQSVASIVENVAASIDLDPYNLKLAAMYHDIGKMWAPELFSENQPKNENPHDSLDSRISYYLITRHVSDSIAILVANNFPTEVIKVVSQHHGTSILKAIFEKEKDKERKDFYRYKTEKPSSIQALIIMLCDTIEATSRSIYGQQNLDVKPVNLISDVFNKIMLDGQFDNVEIKLGFISKIQKTLTTDISANFQKRVAYEEDKEYMHNNES